MSICKDQFISALRDVSCAEFNNIPNYENAIAYSFSKNFDLKMQKLIKSQKKSYWNLINTASKRVAIICIAIITLFCSTLSVEAIRAPIIQFIKDISFRYTKFDDQENEIVNSENNTFVPDENTDGANTYEPHYDENNNLITEETFDDPKTNIYNKMLNTIDFFNTIELTLEMSMTEGEKSTIEYYSNIDGKSAYEAVYDYGVLKFETFCSPNSDYLTHIDHSDKTYNQYHLWSYKRSDTPYIPLQERIITAEDGIPTYSYRRNITNCPLASYSIVPQEMTFSYLKDHELWEIADDNIEHLGRKCIKITGKLSPYIEGKHGCDNFTMFVDAETGIIMKFAAVKNGKTSRYMTVTKCVIDGVPAIKEFDIDQYPSYTEIFR